MSFSENTKYQAYKRANGQCECIRKKCSHVDRCPKRCNISSNDIFIYSLRNEEIPYPGFEFHHKTAKSEGGDDSLSNCEFLCKECHINTQSYGRH